MIDFARPGDELEEIPELHAQQPHRLDTATHQPQRTRDDPYVPSGSFASSLDTSLDPSLVSEAVDDRSSFEFCRI